MIYTDNLTCGDPPNTYPCFDAFVAKVHATHKVYLPLVIRDFPPPYLNPIPTPEDLPTYQVSWDAVPGGRLLRLEEATDPDFTTISKTYDLPGHRNLAERRQPGHPALLLPGQGARRHGR